LFCSVFTTCRSSPFNKTTNELSRGGHERTKFWKKDFETATGYTAPQSALPGQIRRQFMTKEVGQWGGLPYLFGLWP